MWQASAENCQKLTVKVRTMRAGMRPVDGPPRVEDVYSMLRREDQSNLGSAPKLSAKVNTDVTHGILFAFCVWCVVPLVSLTSQRNRARERSYKQEKASP